MIYMVDIKISDILRDKFQENLSIGVIKAKVEIQKKNDLLWNEIDIRCSEEFGDMQLEEVLKIDNIKAARDAYKKLGKDPSRYRLSSESLVRRIVKQKGLFNVNNVVDLSNLLSLVSCNPVCTYDLSRIGDEITFSAGKEGEEYEGIGRGKIKLENLPVFEDEKGKFGSTTSDSIRAMITEDTKEILVFIVSFNEGDNLNNHLKYAEELLKKFAAAENIEKRILK